MYSEAERMVWLESIRNAARSLMTSDLKSGKKKFLDDDLTRKNEESPSKAKVRLYYTSFTFTPIHRAQLDPVKITTKF
jgi:hypothetical protein